MRVSSDSPKCDDERDSEMEHPFKNEIEIKGFPVPYPMHGGYCGHGGAGWGGDGLVAALAVVWAGSGVAFIAL